MTEPTIKSLGGNSTGKADIRTLQFFLTSFWESGGREKYAETKPARDANGIPDSQWFKANLMSIIDDAEVQYGND